MSLGKAFCNLVGVDLPIVQAPMAGSSDAELAIAVAEAGGLGSLPCAMLQPDQVRSSYQRIQERTSRPVNLNFFCHQIPAVDTDREQRWRNMLERYYAEFGLDPSSSSASPKRAPFDEAMCDVVAELKPAVVSALENAHDDQTVMTNVITGRPARGIGNRVIRDLGPMSSAAPEFPRAADALTPLRAKAEENGSGDFSPLWAGQSVALGRELPAGELTQILVSDAVAWLNRLASNAG